MRISAITTDSSRPAGGFSLLEIMVVAALIALLAAIAMPALMRDRGGGPGEQAERLSGVLEQLNEQSLFLGQLLAARLEEDGVQPLRFDHEESEFVAMEGAGELGPLELPADMRLEWRLEETGDREGVDLRDAVSNRMMGDEDEDNSGDGGEDEPPQVFFFPSGEVTPVTFWLRRRGAEGDGLRLELNSVGRVERPARGNGGDED